MPDPCTEAKYSDLLSNLTGLGRAVLAFSGGLDSSFLLYAARQALGDKLLAVTFSTPYMARAEIAQAKQTARDLGVRHKVVEAEFPEEIRDNPPERCYICKRGLFGGLCALAREENLGQVLDGTNLDDLDDYRPGFKALAELKVQSPLLTAGLRKAEIRCLAKNAGLACWDKPAAACLLSRLPHGARVEEAELKRIEEAEEYLKSLGFTAVRLRSHQDLARIELPRERLSDLLEAEDKHGIAARLKALGYRYVSLDLEGYRRGSLNEKNA